MWTISSRALSVAALAAVACLVGARPIAADRTAFFRQLSDKEAADFRDLVVVTHILSRNAHEDKSFEQMRAELVIEGYIPADWTYNPESRVTKGKIAYAICQALATVGEGEYGISGGLSLNLAGPNERYALRECVYLGIIMEGHKNRYIDGGEMLAILARASKFRKTGKALTLQLDEEEEEDEEAEPPPQPQREEQEK